VKFHEEYREVFRPPIGPTPDPGRIFYTITEGDIGKKLIHTTAEVIFVSSFMGQVAERDVGRRLYRVPVPGDRLWIWQLENDMQYQARRAEETLRPDSQLSRFIDMLVS
jgi:hypothetical protein